jgi:hypothetical protein
MYAHQINQTQEIKFTQNELILVHVIFDPPSAPEKAHCWIK